MEIINIYLVLFTELPTSFRDIALIVPNFFLLIVRSDVITTYDTTRLKAQSPSP